MSEITWRRFAVACSGRYALNVNVRIEAANQVKVLLARAASFGRSRTVSLPDFDRESFDLLQVRPGWTYEQWLAVHKETVRQLRARGLNVRFVAVANDEYIRFLCDDNRRSNKDSTRAEFIASKLALPPRPSPVIVC